MIHNSHFMPQSVRRKLYVFLFFCFIVPLILWGPRIWRIKELYLNKNALNGVKAAGEYLRSNEGVAPSDLHLEDITREGGNYLLRFNFYYHGPSAKPMAEGDYYVSYSARENKIIKVEKKLQYNF